MTIKEIDLFEDVDRDEQVYTPNAPKNIRVVRIQEELQGEIDYLNYGDDF